MSNPSSGVTPHLNASNAAAAIELYQRAFGAEILAKLPADDGKRIMHCCLRINGGTLFVADGFPEEGYPALAPQGISLHLQVADAEAVWQRAVDAGLAITTPLAVQFWGDKFGRLRDAFGVTWSIAGPAK